MFGWIDRAWIKELLEDPSPPDMDGLVVCDEWLADMPIGMFVPFRPGCHWVPYRGGRT